MNPDLEKLIKMAGEGAGLTEKKREIILRKAQELGEDSAEVEMALENMYETSRLSTIHKRETGSVDKANPTWEKPVSSRCKCPQCGSTIPDNTGTCPGCGFIMASPATSPVKSSSVLTAPDFVPETSSDSRRRRCPNCGEVISDYTLVCPNCGFALDSESTTSTRVQQQIDAFNKRLEEVDQVALIRKTGKKLALIHGFTVPMTKEALVLGFTYVKTQFLSAKNTGIATAEAWRAKAMQFHDLLKAQPNLDDQTKRFIEDNEYLFTFKKPSSTGFNLLKCLVFISVAFFVIVVVCVLADTI